MNTEEATTYSSGSLKLGTVAPIRQSRWRHCRFSIASIDLLTDPDNRLSPLAVVLRTYRTLLVYVLHRESYSLNRIYSVLLRSTGCMDGWWATEDGFPLDPTLWTQRHWRRWPTADARPYRVMLVVDTTRLFWELWIESVSQLYSIVVINGCGDLQMLVNEAAKTGMFFITLLFSFLCLVSAVRRWPSAHLDKYRAASPFQYPNMHGYRVERSAS